MRKQHDSTHIEARRLESAERTAMTARLIAEFAGRVSADTVTRCVAKAREQLLATGVRAGLAAATESMARLRLQQLVPVHPG